MRKIIQLLYDEDGYLVALCDDGTIWYWCKHDSCWEPLHQPIHQD